MHVTIISVFYILFYLFKNSLLAFGDHLFVSSHSSDLYACCKIDLKISIWKYYCSNIATIHYYVFSLSKLLLKLYKLFSKSCYLRCPTSHSAYLRASDKTVDILISKHYNLLTVHIFYSDLSCLSLFSNFVCIVRIYIHSGKIQSHCSIHSSCVHIDKSKLT